MSTTTFTVSLGPDETAILGALASAGRAHSRPAIETVIRDRRPDLTDDPKMIARLTSIALGNLLSIEVLDRLDIDTWLINDSGVELWNSAVLAAE